MLSLCACLALGVPQGEAVVTPLAIDPHVTLALRVLEIIGATAPRVALDRDPSVTPDEADAFVAALRTSAVEIIEGPADTVVRLARVDAWTVLAQIRQRGAEIWNGQVRWPSAKEPVAATPSASGDLSERVRDYWRRELRVESVGITRFASSLALPPPAAPYTPPASSTDIGWRMVQGPNEVLDELEFARLVGDPALVAHIEETRHRFKLAWGLGFGLGGAVLTAVGVPLLAVDLGPSVNRGDAQTAGLSLLVVGAASIAVALFFPTVGEDPVQTADEAAQRAQRYNGRLRRELQLSEDEATSAATP